MLKDPLMFNSGKEYMTKGELMAVENFLADAPKDVVYVKDGKKLIFLMYKLPVGSYVVNYSKIIGKQEIDDGTFYYTTPLATLTYQPNEKKEVKVWVKDITSNKTYIVTGNEWMIFSKSAETEEKEEGKKMSAYGMAEDDNKAFFDNLRIKDSQIKEQEQADELNKLKKLVKNKKKIK